MIEAIILVLAFVTGFGIIFAVNMVITDLFLKDRIDQRKRMERQLLERQRSRVRGAASGQNLDQLAAEAMEQNAAERSLWGRLREMVEQSGMELSPGKLMVACFVTAGVLGVPVGLLSRSVAAGVLTGIVVWPLPILFVDVVRRRRLEAFRAQLPDSLELMSRVLRAGQTVNQGMKAVAEEFPRPISEEFAYCYEQQNLGLSQEVALRDLAKRSGLLEIQIFVLSLLVHRRSGGNLTEVLDGVASVIRERFRLRGKIKAITAEGRFQALALMVLPVFAFLMLILVNRPYALKLLDHPWLIVVSLISMSIGAVWIHRIVNFDF